MSPLSAFTLYQVWHRNMVQYIRFQQAIVSGCALASCCRLLQGNSFVLFQSPAVDSPVVCRLMSSPTGSTCAPGVVLYPRPLPPGALSSGVVHDSAGPLLSTRQRPASASKKKHGKPGADENPESTTTDSPPYP